MSPFELLALLLVAGVCGSLGRALAGFGRLGCLVSIALGFIGALVGTWLQRLLELPEPLALDVGDQRFPVVWSIAGSALFVALLGLLGGGGRRAKR